MSNQNPMNRAELNEWQAQTSENNRIAVASVSEDRAEKAVVYADNAQWQAFVTQQVFERDKQHRADNARRDARLEENIQRLAAIEAATKGIVDTMASWTGAMKTIESIGKALRPLTWIVTFFAACVGLWISIKHGMEDK